MACGIYLIVHRPSGRGYVGQSVNIESRFNDHKAGRGSRKLKHALTKYGLGEFDFKILLLCKPDHLNLYESLAVEALGTLHPRGFNLIPGGFQPGAMSEETRDKYRKAGKQIGRLAKSTEVKKKREEGRQRFLSTTSPEERKKLWGSRRDERVYKFVHSSGLVRFGRRIDLQEEFELDPARLSDLVRGKAKTHKGWALEVTER